MNPLRALLPSALVLLALSHPSRAAAEQVRRRGTEMLTPWLVLDAGPVDGVGLGGRYMMPIAPEGVLRHPRIRDEFTLEFGVDFLHYEDSVGDYPAYEDYSWNGFVPVVGATWNFWFTPRVAVYPKLDLGWRFGWYSGWDPGPGYSQADFDGLFLQGAIGLVYRLETVALRVELGSDLLRLGVGFPY
jgi:hypothetical protein